MSEIIKVIGTEQSCNTTANTFAGSKWVRLVNVNTSSLLITRAYSNGAVIGTFSLAAGSSCIAEKNPTDTLASNTASAFVLGTTVAYKN